MNKIKRRIFDIIQIGQKEDLPSRGFDIFIVTVILLNVVVMFLTTFQELDRFQSVFSFIETATVIVFCIEYVLRIWTAEFLFPKVSKGKAILKFLISFDGIVDLLTILPFFFLTGFVAFRMLRVVRILHLFRINTQYDSFNVIKSVLYEKRNQIASSLFIILILILASSITMYSVEHEAQPEAFANGFSGIWWSVSALLTVGYGDVYPVTTLGKCLAIVIAFLGVGAVAIPTGIISAGFVEHYQRVKRFGDTESAAGLRFIEVTLERTDSWVGQSLGDLKLPKGILVVAVQRGSDTIIPRGKVDLKTGDHLILAAEHAGLDHPVELREVVVDETHEWNGKAIKDLDISRQTFIVGVKRHGDMFIPRGKTVIGKGDTVLLYSKTKKLDTDETI